MKRSKLNGSKGSTEMKDSTVIVIVGPTAVGKTNLAISLAKNINGEIISADSRLFYRGMDIGTDKPDKSQMAEIPHYLIDVAEPKEVWSLSVFQKKVTECIRDIQSRGKKAIVVGGTGQYIHALTEGWEIPPLEPSNEMRSLLETWGKEIGCEELQKKLSILDPKAAEKIDFQNSRRTVRALEVIFCTGKRFSDQRSKNKPEFCFKIIGLNRPRQELYTRIDQRIDEMFQSGLIEETQELLKQGIPVDHPNLSAIGYREVIQFLEGKITIEEAKTQMKRKTREFVRRQANWFKVSDPEIHWFEMTPDPLNEIIKICA